MDISFLNIVYLSIITKIAQLEIDTFVCQLTTTTTNCYTQSNRWIKANFGIIQYIILDAFIQSPRTCNTHSSAYTGYTREKNCVATEMKREKALSITTRSDDITTKNSKQSENKNNYENVSSCVFLSHSSRLNLSGDCETSIKSACLGTNPIRYISPAFSFGHAITLSLSLFAYKHTLKMLHKNRFIFVEITMLVLWQYT